MDSITALIKDLDSLVFISGLILLLFAILDIKRIQTKWFTFINNKSKKITIGLLGFILLIFSFIPMFIVPSATNVCEDKTIKDNDKLQWYWPGQNWSGEMRFFEQSGILKTEVNVKKIGKTITQSGGSMRSPLEPEVIRTLSRGNIIPSGDKYLISNLQIRGNQFNTIKEPTPDSSGNFIFEGFTVIDSNKYDVEGHFAPIRAFAGEIQYTNKSDGSTQYGGIVLFDLNQ